MSTPNLQKLQSEAADYHRHNQFEHAEKRYREILRHAPNAAEIHNARGAALVSLKRLKDAAEAFGRATALQPDNENFRYNFANSLKEQKLFSQAIEQFTVIVHAQPNHIAARIQLGLLYQQGEQWREAIEQFNEVCKQNPTMTESFERLGYCLIKIWRYSDAESAFQHALKVSLNSFPAHRGLADALIGLNRVSEAVEWLKKALLLSPDSYPTKVKLGRALVEYGSHQEAVNIFESIIKTNPEDVAAYKELAVVKKFREEDKNYIFQVERLLQEGRVNEVDLIGTYFSLGKMYDDIGFYDKAFGFYNQGCKLSVPIKNRAFDLEILRSEVTALCSTYGKSFFASHTGIGHDSDIPIFVIGMPRSGTTLTEQILSSHPQAMGAGEVNFWSGSSVMLPIELGTETSYPECVNLLNRLVANRIGDKYLAQLSQLISDVSAKHIVDKMPQNFFFLGLITAVFPKAKIIHIQRNAMDNCLSIYFQNFKDGHLYSYDLETLGHYYKEYERLMQYWREVLPIKMLEINYEELVADQERVTREMIDYVGLPWDERCLQPEKSNKVVRTASLWQARQPVYKTSVARWKRYEKHLQPLRDALGYTEK